MFNRKHDNSAADAIGVALLGAGKIAQTHARILAAMPGVRLAAVCDVDGNKAESLACRFAIPAFFDNSGEMLRRERIDAVHVLTPPPYHAAAAVECLEAGRHVLIEKPMTLTTGECDRIRRAAGLSGKTVGVNHNSTFFPVIERVVEAIHSRRLGKVECFTGSFSLPVPLSMTGLFMLREPGNIIFETGAHPLSQVLRVMGRVHSASTVAANRITLASGKPFYRTWLISLLCERGPAQLHFAFGPDHVDGWVRVVGQDGTASADLKRNTLHLSGDSRFAPAVDNLVDGCRHTRAIARDTAGEFANFCLNLLGIRRLSDNFTLPMRCSIEDFYAALGQGRAPRAGLEFGAAVVEACEAIVRDSGVARPEGEREERVYA